MSGNHEYNFPQSAFAVLALACTATSCCPYKAPRSICCNVFICSTFLFVIFCFGVCTSSSASSTNICHLPKKSLLCLQNIYDRDDLETCNQSSPKLSKLHKSIMEPARCWICKQGTRDSSKSWHLRTSFSVRQCINANMGKKAI